MIAAWVIGGGAYAFTASNTVPATTVGAGAGVVSGFTVTNLHYALNATTPARIRSVDAPGQGSDLFNDRGRAHRHDG